MFERLDTICLSVTNLDQSSAWYQKVLGLDLVFKGEGYRVFAIGESEVPLTIEEGHPGQGKKTTYPIFFTKDINQTYEKLLKSDVKVSEIEADGTNRYFDFYDLDNNRLQVCFWK
ncbi:VOC family protein [Thalassobacillus sp. B23F22_16]|uniref:VOC family protein n=1 Tax=Thalassobacillus sp. B23F22_16 TaxID=3459513 RepID=UPI00373EF6D7